MMKIGFVGASGYGNTGDDTYPILFREYLGNKHKLVFMNSDINKFNLSDLDLIVMGGGGIVYCNDTAHFDYMKYYMDYAIDNEIPLSFVSVGIQSRTNDFSFLEQWREYFDYAHLITVRSKKDKELIESYSDTVVNYFPDLCYDLSPILNLKTDKNHVVIIPARNISIKNENVCRLVNDLALKNNRFSILNFGGHCVYDITEKKIQGFKKLLADKKCDLHLDLGPYEYLNIIKTANRVITGRYHGLIFAKSCGIKKENIYYEKKGFKFENEDIDLDKNEMLNSRLHIVHLEKFIDYYF